eukprot:5269178-Pleurochrysis_carterae.AAC.1
MTTSTSWLVMMVFSAAAGVSVSTGSAVVPAASAAASGAASVVYALSTTMLRAGASTSAVFALASAFSTA